MRGICERVKKAGMMIIVFIIIPLMTFADAGEPCDDSDPLDNECPIDNWVYMLVLVVIAIIIAYYYLKRNQKNLSV